MSKEAYGVSRPVILHVEGTDMLAFEEGGDGDVTVTIVGPDEEVTVPLEALKKAVSLLGKK